LKLSTQNGNFLWLRLQNRGKANKRNSDFMTDKSKCHYSNYYCGSILPILERKTFNINVVGNDCGLSSSSSSGNNDKKTDKLNLTIVNQFRYNIHIILNIFNQKFNTYHLIVLDRIQSGTNRVTTSIKQIKEFLVYLSEGKPFPITNKNFNNSTSILPGILVANCPSPIIKSQLFTYRNIPGHFLLLGDIEGYCYIWHFNTVLYKWNFHTTFSLFLQEDITSGGKYVAALEYCKETSTLLWIERKGNNSEMTHIDIDNQNILSSDDLNNSKKNKKAEQNKLLGSESMNEKNENENTDRVRTCRMYLRDDNNIYNTINKDYDSIFKDFDNNVCLIGPSTILKNASVESIYTTNNQKMDTNNENQYDNEGKGGFWIVSKYVEGKDLKVSYYDVHESRLLSIDVSLSGGLSIVCVNDNNDSNNNNYDNNNDNNDKSHVNENNDNDSSIYDNNSNNSNKSSNNSHITNNDNNQNKQTSLPSMQPSSQPSTQPSSQPSSRLSTQPSSQPSMQPSTQPSSQPTNNHNKQIIATTEKPPNLNITIYHKFVYLFYMVITYIS